VNGTLCVVFKRNDRYDPQRKKIIMHRPLGGKRKTGDAFPNSFQIVFLPD